MITLWMKKLTVWPEYTTKTKKEISVLFISSIFPEVKLN